MLILHCNLLVSHIDFNVLAKDLAELAIEKIPHIILFSFLEHKPSLLLFVIVESFRPAETLAH
jgi:hypothetical protein